VTAATSITVLVPLAIRRRGGWKLVVTPGGNALGATSARMDADPALVKALARTHRWKRLLESGRYSSLSELAAAEKIDRSYLGKMLRLTLLAPDIVEAVPQVVGAALMSDYELGVVRMIPMPVHLLLGVAAARARILAAASAFGQGCRGHRVGLSRAVPASAVARPVPPRIVPSVPPNASASHYCKLPPAQRNCALGRRLSRCNNC
jgi:hypothetical protein